MRTSLPPRRENSKLRNRAALGVCTFTQFGAQNGRALSLASSLVCCGGVGSPLKPPACFSQAAYIAELEHRSEQGTTQPGFLRTVVVQRRYCGRVRDLEEPQELLLQPTWQQEAGKTWTSSGGLEKTSCRTSKRKRSARSPLHAIQLRRASVFRFLSRFLSISECSTGVSMGRQYDYRHVSAAIWVTVVSARSRANQHSPADAGRKRCKARGCGFGAARGRGVCETAVLGWR